MTRLFPLRITASYADHYLIAVATRRHVLPPSALPLLLKIMVVARVSDPNPNPTVAASHHRSFTLVAEVGRCGGVNDWQRDETEQQRH